MKTATCRRLGPRMSVRTTRGPVAGALIALVALVSNMGCSSTDGDGVPLWSCRHGGEVPDFLHELGCLEDFHRLASVPADASIPGARSVKTVIDRYDQDRLYFQHSERYPIHWAFASEQLSGGALPVVPLLADFNTTEYSSPSRRFLLGAVTHYEGPDVYTYEIAPYDQASVDLILSAYGDIKAATWFGENLRFFASSAAVEVTVRGEEEALNLITQAELFAGIDYQPLNLAESYGRLRFATAESLATEYLGFRDVVVLDQVPNDISVVSGIITEAFQTPLSHINVLSRNRGTPNMALRGAFQNPALRALEGQWVRFGVASEGYTVAAVSADEADAWWEANKPQSVQVPGLDREVVELTDIEAVLAPDHPDLKDSVKVATRAFGGKAAHYAALSQIEGLPVPKAFAVPVHFYLQFMEDNGFTARVEALLEDRDFQQDPAYRDQALGQLREDMKAAPLDPAFEAALIAKLQRDYPNIRMRFRSSTNAEDLDGFTGAGLYISKSADLNDPERPVADAVRKVWASVWFFRAFEERSYRSIDHLSVAMALLVHRSFPDEEANGVALTNNPFDRTGLDPAFYINVQVGETSVVLPPAGVTADSFLYYFDRAEQPVTYLSNSSLTLGGQPVLNPNQRFQLGQALDRIRQAFAPAYGTNGNWWAMDVEFKFDGLPGEEPALFVKQARPYQ